MPEGDTSYLSQVRAQDRHAAPRRIGALHLLLPGMPAGHDRGAVNSSALVGSTTRSNAIPLIRVTVSVRLILKLSALLDFAGGLSQS